jgi:uncharacterized membrane protein
MKPIYKSQSIFKPGQTDRISQAVADAERQTSAEIALIVTRYCWGDIRDKARRLFHKNNLHQTEGRNAVMIFVVTANREFLIYGDESAHEKLGAEYWPQTCERLTQRASEQGPGEAIIATIEQLGHDLAQHFPPAADNVNEISDGVIHAT